MCKSSHETLRQKLELSFGCMVMAVCRGLDRHGHDDVLAISSGEIIDGCSIAEISVVVKPLREYGKTTS